MFMMNCTVPEGSTPDKKAYTDDDPSYRKKFTVDFEEGEKPIRYGYHYIVSTVPEGYRVRVFQPDKKVLTEMKTYSTPNLTLLHGSFQSNWDDGSIRAQGIYQYGRKHGMWVESEPGRGKSSSGLYDSELKDGEWTQLDTNGLIESIYTWKDGKLHGKFFLFDSTGQKINEGIYRSDTLVGELYKQPIVTKPYLRNCADNTIGDVNECTTNSLASTIYTNLKYPSQAREKKIEGTAIVQWDILPDGSVSNIRVPQGLSNEIEKECIRVFKLTGKWVPAYQDGKPVKFTMSVPISFRLQ
jgi:TonB family protein